MQGLFEIDRITDREGNERLDGRYPLRIGRRGKLHLQGCGATMTIEYVPREGENYGGFLHTSKVEEMEAVNGIHQITTMNSVYYFKELY